MKVQVNNYGQKIIRLISESGKEKTETVGQLVAKHFIPNPNNYAHIDFLDGDPLNCRADNLKWVKITSRQVKQYDAVKKRVNRYSLNGKYIDSFNSVTEAASVLHEEIKNYSESYMMTAISSSCKTNKPFSCYQWRFASAGDNADIERYVPDYIIYQLDKKTKEVINKFTSIKEIADFLGKSAVEISANIRNCCFGNRPTAYGYIWIKKDGVE